MTSQQTATQVITIVAGANITQKRFVAWNDQTAGAGVAIKGVADHTILSGESGRLVIGPTAMVEAGAAVSGSETRLMSDSQGRVVPYVAGSTNIIAARFKTGQTAAAAGELIEVFLLPQSATVAAS